MKLHMVAMAVLLVPALVGAEDPFLHALYDRLHDSPVQRKLRELAPMPFGVVFLPWKGMTEGEMREQFRTMKKLGFHNLKQTMGSAEWPESRILEVALEEDIIPFWYGEGGWEPVTAELLRKLGLPETLSRREIREHPKVRAYQKEVLRRGIGVRSGRALLGEEGPSYVHVPDPFLRAADVGLFQKWLRTVYRSAADVADAWNQYEVGFEEKPFRTWEDVDRGVAAMAAQGDNLRGYGREYGRVRDVLRYKADYRVKTIREITDASSKANPFAPTRSGGEMGLFLPFSWRATNMEKIADTQRETGSFYPSIHFAWHYGEVGYEVARPIYMQVSFAADLFKGGWSGAWESTGGPQQLTGGKGWDYPEQSTMAGFTVNAGTMTQLFLSYLAGGFRGAGVWTWNPRRAGWEGGEFALVDRQMRPSERAVRAGKIAMAANRYRDELWKAHKEPLVGVLYNWDSDAIWAATSVRGRDHFRHYPMQARVGVSRALINGNIPWEHVTPDDLRAGLAPRYGVIYLPAQIALSEELLELLDRYAEGGGRVVLDAPGGWYDEHGLMLKSAAFSRLFGVDIADFQYSNNVPRWLGGDRLRGFVLELKPGTARVVERFASGEIAVTENRRGKGSAVVVGYDASFGCFRPGNGAGEARIRRYALGGRVPPFACEGAIAYRIAAPEADHYFLINDGPAAVARMRFTGYRYKSAQDAVTGESIALGAPIAVEAHGGRWVRFAK